MASCYIYHLVEKTRWRATDAEGYRPPTFDADGFIHATKEAELLVPIANQFYTGVPGKFLCLRIDTNILKSEVKFEAAEPVGNKPAYTTGESVEEKEPRQQQEQYKHGDKPDHAATESGDEVPAQHQHQQQKRKQQLFPHIYGPINTPAVVAELAVMRADDGKFLSIAGL